MAVRLYIRYAKASPGEPIEETHEYATWGVAIDLLRERAEDGWEIAIANIQAVPVPLELTADEHETILAIREGRARIVDCGHSTHPRPTQLRRGQKL